jgi:hypothetical protein
MADSALSGLYRKIGVKRDDEISDRLWRRMEAGRKQAEAGEGG